MEALFLTRPIKAVSGQNRSFTYDALGQLSTASGPWGSGSYVYDALSNLRSKTLGSRVVELQYDGQNRLSQFRDTDEGNVWQNDISYDARGNMTDTGFVSLGASDFPMT